MEALLCQDEARSAGDESSLDHQGTSGGATGLTRVLNSIKNTLTSLRLDWEPYKSLLVHTYGLVAALKGEINQ